MTALPLSPVRRCPSCLRLLTGPGDGPCPSCVKPEPVHAGIRVELERSGPQEAGYALARAGERLLHGLAREAAKRGVHPAWWTLRLEARPPTPVPGVELLAHLDGYADLTQLERARHLAERAELVGAGGARPDEGASVLDDVDVFAWSWNRMDRAGRESALSAMRHAADERQRCFMEDHDQRLEELDAVRAAAIHARTLGMVEGMARAVAALDVDEATEELGAMLLTAGVDATALNVTGAPLVALTFYAGELLDALEPVLRLEANVLDLDGLVEDEDLALDEEARRELGERELDARLAEFRGLAGLAGNTLPPV